MKKVLLVTLLFFIGLQSADANRKGGKEPKSVEKRIEKVMDKLDKHLDLTDTQEQKIKTLFTDFFKDGDQKGDRKERKSEIEQLDQKIKDLLTDDQKDKFDKMKLNKKMRKGKNK